MEQHTLTPIQKLTSEAVDYLKEKVSSEKTGFILLVLGKDGEHIVASDLAPVTVMQVLKGLLTAYSAEHASDNN